MLSIQAVRGLPRLRAPGIDRAVSNSSLFTPDPLKANSFVFFAVRETRSNDIKQRTRSSSGKTPENDNNGSVIRLDKCTTFPLPHPRTLVLPPKITVANICRGI